MSPRNLAIAAFAAAFAACGAYALRVAREDMEAARRAE